MFSPRILIVKMSSIGDVVHTLPAVATLRNHYPNAYLAWVVEEKSYNILVGNPLINELILFERKKIIRAFKSGHIKEGWKAIQDLKARLRAGNFELSIDLQGLARSAFIVYLANARKKLGCPGMRELSYLISKPPSNSETRNLMSTHAVDRLLQVIKSLDNHIVPVVEFPIALNNSATQFATDFLQQNNIADSDILIGINLGASNLLKLWQKENFVELINRLQDEFKYRVILFGGKADIPFSDTIISSTKTEPANAVGKTELRQLAAIAKRCAVFVSGDSGPIHIATAVGTPVVALFGPSDPNKTGPYTEKKVVIWKKPECSPCSYFGQCDFDKICMEQITVNEVLNAIKDLITNSVNNIEL